MIALTLLLPFALLSAVALWSRNAVFFLMAGAAGQFAGFYWYDTFTTTQGLGESVAILVAGLSMWGLAFRYLLYRDDEV